MSNFKKLEFTKVLLQSTDEHEATQLIKSVTRNKSKTAIGTFLFKKNRFLKQVGSFLAEVRKWDVGHAFTSAIHVF